MGAVLQHHRRGGDAATPWGELGTMPLDEFRNYMFSAAVPGTTPGTGPALNRLPGAAGQAGNYTAMPPESYRTRADFISRDPQLSSLPEADRTSLLESTTRLNLGPTDMLYLSYGMQSGSITPAEAHSMIGRLAAAGNHDDGVELLQVHYAAQEAQRSGRLTEAQVGQLMDSHPERHQSASGVQGLISDLQNPAKGWNDISARVNTGLVAEAANMDVSQASTLLTRLARENNPAAFEAVFNHIAANWTMTSDDVAESVVQNSTPELLNHLSRATLHRLYDAMNDIGQDPGTHILMARLQQATNW